MNVTERTHKRLGESDQNIEGLEHISVGSIRDLGRKLNAMTAAEAIQLLRVFAEEHELDEPTALKAGRVARSLAL